MIYQKDPVGVTILMMNMYTRLEHMSLTRRIYTPLVKALW